jgi:hypothetical protein
MVSLLLLKDLIEILLLMTTILGGMSIGPLSRSHQLNHSQLFDALKLGLQFDMWKDLCKWMACFNCQKNLLTYE